MGIKSKLIMPVAKWTAHHIKKWSARAVEDQDKIMIPADGSTPYHEWFVEFVDGPKDMVAFSTSADLEMVKQNIYYEDLIKGNILQHLKINKMKSGAFRSYMKDQGKLGGQNKVPHLSNDRKIADQLNKYIDK